MVSTLDPPDELLDELRGGEDDPTAPDARERNRPGARDYPRPDEGDILSLKSYLETLYQPLHDGQRIGQDDARHSGLKGLRALRYGQDTTPEKLHKRLSNDIRVRSMQSHRLIFQVRSLLGRNPLRVSIPAASSAASAIAGATAETRWSNELAPVFARNAAVDPIQESDDAQCEAFGGWEVYLTDAYDGLDTDPLPGEDRRAYRKRLSELMRSAGCPIGLRALDPLSTLIELSEDGEGIASVLIVERKARRPLARSLRQKLGPDAVLRAQISEGGMGASGYDAGASPYADVESVRYYDPYWYAWMVGGRIVDVRPHGHPGIPVFPAWGFVTSSRNLGLKFQGVAYALAFSEPIVNDLMTQQADAQETYNRPKPIASAPADAPEADTAVIDLSGPELQLLPPGYQLDDAFKAFRAQTIDPTIGMLLGLGAQQSINPVLSGEVPSADTSGFALNLQSANAVGPYLPLFRGKERAWAGVVDHCRRLVRDTIRLPVSFATESESAEHDAVIDWIELRPDEVTDIPCKVSIDPLSDLERIAIAKWYEGGVRAGVVPERVWMERGFGADDPQSWYDEIDRDAARRQLRPLRIQQAFNELLAEQQAASQAPVIFGPNGEPLMQGGPTGGAMQQAGAMATPPTGSTIGEGAGLSQQPSPQNFAQANAGQMPPGQGAQMGGVTGALRG